MNNLVPCQMIQRDFGLVFVPSLNPPPPAFITVQHCGFGKEIFQGLFQERKSATPTDLKTFPLAMDIFRAASPYVAVIYNQFNRHYIETNVHPAEAYCDKRLAQYYDSFHREIDDRIAESFAFNGPCVLLDLHGFGNQPEYAPPGGYDAILGTGNRSTVQITDRARRNGKNNLDYRLREGLESNGLSVFCPESEPIREKMWRERASKDCPNKQIVPRNLIGEEEYESDSNFLQPPEIPDHLNGGYLIRKHTENSDRVAAAIQIELVYPVRDRDESKNEGEINKRMVFVHTVAALIKEISA